MTDDASLEDVLLTPELSRRPIRESCPLAENQALHALARQISSDPETMLDTLMAVSLDLCGAGSAGVSLLENAPDGGSSFRWVALTGLLTHLGRHATIPRHASPSGVCLDRNAPQLFRDPARHFAYLRGVHAPIVEALVVPFCAGEVALGTVWVATHDRQRVFDLEDVRVMTSLASFAAATFRVSAANELLERLYSNERDYAAKLQRLTEAAIAMNAAASLRETLQVVTEQARRLTGARQAVTSMTPDRTWGREVEAESSDEGRPLPQAPDRAGAAVCSLVCRTNRPVRFTQAELEACDDAAPAESPARRGWLAAPLVGHDGRNMGLIQLTDRGGGEFSGEDEATLVQLAQMASSTIEKARLYAKLQDADQRKDEFLAMLSHELRNPLGAISNVLTLLERRLGGGDAQVARLSQLLERQVRQMTRLLADLLEVSRITSGKVKLKRRALDLAGVIHDSIATAQPLLAAQRHTLILRLPSEPLRVNADPTRLEQVLVNLLNNAAKYTEPGGRIAVAAVRRADEVVITVRDNGIGIAREALPGLFDLFTQGERGLDRAQGGLGLGLTLVRSLVELHGGKAEARSAGPGAGSEFEVRLPLLASPAAAGAGAAGAAGGGRARRASPPDPCRSAPWRADAAGAPQGRRSAARAEEARRADGGAGARPLRVLVVEDNRDAALTLRDLVQHLGHEVSVVHDGRIALALAARLTPDVVLLDIGLPSLDGYEVARRLRAAARMRGSLLVALTGYGARTDRERSRQAGFDGHLIKPVPVERLERLLRRYARRPLGVERGARRA